MLVFQQCPPEGQRLWSQTLKSSREGTRVGLESHRASSEAPGGVCTFGSNISHYWERTQTGSKTTTISNHKHFWLLWEKTPAARRSQVLFPDAEHILHDIQKNRNDFPLCSRKIMFKCFFRSYLSTAQLPKRAAASATDLCTPPDSLGYQILSLFDKQILSPLFSEQDLTEADPIPKPPASFLTMKPVCSTAMEKQLLLQLPKAICRSLQPISYLCLRAL